MEKTTEEQRKISLDRLFSEDENKEEIYLSSCIIECPTSKEYKANVKIKKLEPTYDSAVKKHYFV